MEQAESSLFDVLKMKNLDAVTGMKYSAKQIIGSFLDYDGPSGTWAYMSPELIKEEKINEKVDVWSLGIIFHQIFTQGFNPFRGKDLEETKNKIIDPKIELDENLCKNPLFKKILDGN